MSDQQERRQWRALIYNRASSDKTGQGVSCESQDVENHATCAREGWEVAGVVTDNDRSATRFAVRDREGFRTVHDGLTDGRWGRIDVLVSVASSRNQRRLDGYVELRSLCERHTMRLAYDGSVYDMTVKNDRFLTGLHALMDESAAEDIRDGILRSHRNSVAAGKPRGSIPFGYTREYNPGTRRMNRQVPDPRTATVVQGIVADVLAGVTLYSIAQRLNRDKAPTPQSERDRRRQVEVERAGWSSTMIRNLLAKPSLAGMRTHNGVVAGPGDWEPIVSTSDWAAVKALLAEPRRVAHHGGREAVWLCSGIARCGVCQAWLRPMRRKGVMTYGCAGVTPTSPKGHVSRKAELLDAYITSRVIRRLADPEFASALARRSTSGAQGVAATAVKLAELETRMAAFVSLAASKQGIEAQAFESAIAGIAVEVEQARAEHRAALPRHVPPRVLALAGPNATAVWNSPHVQGDMGLQREAVRVLLAVTVHRSASPPGSAGFDRSSVAVVEL